MNFQTRTALRAAAVRAHQEDKGSKIRGAAEKAAALGLPAGSMAPLPPLSISHFTREIELAAARQHRVVREAAEGVPASSRQVLRRPARITAKS